MEQLFRLPVRGLALPLAVVLAFLAGCGVPLNKPTAANSDEAALSVRNFQVETADGHLTVLLRLSGIPTLVRHSESSSPAQIVVQAWGPPGAEDLAERTLPQSDGAISLVRVSRKDGALRVTVDFVDSKPPPYTVHQMADWIMIRLSPSGGEG